MYNPDSEPLDQFIKRKGGINACAARFARWVGRGHAVSAMNPVRKDNKRLRSGIAQPTCLDLYHVVRARRS